MINVRWVQHPIGHGGFHTGIMISPDRPTFTWIFDCGAKRTAKFDDYLRRWLRRHPQPIDWLFVSHFDTDHVSGLETLMSRAVVVDVMVPYLNERELVIQLLYEAGRNSLSRTLVELAADPAGYFLSRGAERVTFLNGGASERPELAEDPDRPLPEGRGWEIKCYPPPRALKPPKWAKTGLTGESAVRIINGECDLSIVHAGEGIRFKPYRAPLDANPHRSLIATVEKLTGGTMASLDRPGLGDLAYSVAKHARTPAGRKTLRELFKAQVGSSNRSSLSLLSIPVSTADLRHWYVAQPRASWHSDYGEPAWLNTGDAEILSASDLSDWEVCYSSDLSVVQVLGLPHHGSDHNSDARLQALCPDAVLTAHVNSTSKKHPGLHVALAAGLRLAPVTEDAATLMEMWYLSH
jgi:hypothetical protein